MHRSTAFDARPTDSGRPDERVAESDDLPVRFYEARPERLLDAGRGIRSSSADNCPEFGHRRAARQGHGQNGVFALMRQPAQSLGQQRLGGCRHCQRLARRGHAAGRVHRADDLESEERIAVRRRRHARDECPAAGASGLSLDDAADCPERKRAQGQPLHESRRQRSDHVLDGRRRHAGPNAGEEGESLVRRAPQREGECRGRRLVTPLEVVDGEQHGDRVGDRPDHVEDGEPEGGTVELTVVGSRPAKGDLEGAAARRRECRQDRLDPLIRQQAGQ